MPNLNTPASADQPLPATAVAVAACAFALPPSGDGNTIQVQLTPAGAFTPSDGRAMPVPAWRIDAAAAARVIAAFGARTNPAVLDYEHQTLLAADNGQPAPAAGWIRRLNWREGSGLFGTVELTARASGYIAAGEYRYISPVFSYSPVTGEVLAIEMAALTNHPALDGMEQVQLRAAATFGHAGKPAGAEPPIHTGDKPMDKTLQALIAALALDEGANDDVAIAALTARLDELRCVRTTLGIAADADATAAVAACTAIKARADTPAAVDPRQYIGIAAFEEVKAQLAALTTRHTATEVAALVDQGLKDTQLLPGQKDWATRLGMTNLAALKEYLATTAPIAALRGTQTNGQPPSQTAATHGLTADELAVCSATGVAPEAFAKARSAQA